MTMMMMMMTTITSRGALAEKETSSLPSTFLRFRTTTKENDEIDSFPDYYHTTSEVYDYFQSISKNSDDEDETSSSVCPSRGKLFRIILDNVEKDGTSLLTVTFQKNEPKEKETKEGEADEEALFRFQQQRRRRKESSRREASRRRAEKETPPKNPATFTTTTTTPSPPERIMFLFGEHAREFVSVESAIALSEALCHAADSDDHGEKEDDLAVLARRMLQRYDEILLVPVANPLGRARAEGGDFCYRANEDGIDLNRNWGDHWESTTGTSGDLNSGSGPFSEPETKILKEIVDDLAAKDGGLRVFVTVHSGTLGMYTPFAYSRDVPQRPEEKEMLKLLYPLDEEHCQCPMGAAGKEVGYLCPGTCLDYAYDVAKVPYAFAFEIYADEKETANCRATFEQQKHRFAADASFASASRAGTTSDSRKSTSSSSSSSSSNTRSVAFANALEPFSLVEIEAEAGVTHRHSDFLMHRQATSQRTARRMEPENCFGFFNPTTEEDLRSVTDKWVHVYLKLATRIPSAVVSGVLPPEGESIALSSSTKQQLSETMDVAMAMGVSSSSVVASPA